MLQCSDIDVSLKDKYGRAALILAVLCGEYCVVEVLLKHPLIDETIQGRQGRNALSSCYSIIRLITLPHKFVLIQ
jgi:hypothetical protein